MLGAAALDMGSVLRLLRHALVTGTGKGLDVQNQSVKEIHTCATR